MRDASGCALITLLFLCADGSAYAQTAAPPPTSAAVAPNDYSRDASWLCRPGRQDACAVDLTTTIVHANAHHMATVIERADEAIARIKAAGSELLAIKRF